MSLGVIDPRALAAAQQVLLAAWAGQTEKAAPGTPNATLLYAPGGTLSYPGSRADILNSYILPQQGLAGKLQRRKSTEAQALLDILTGQTLSSGTNPTAACADGKQPGNLKVMKRTFTFGRIPMDSQVIQIDKVGLVLNRGVFRDRNVVGDPIGPSGANGLIPTTMSLNEAIRNEYRTKILELMLAANRDYARMLYTGNPANTAGSEGYIEFLGLDRQINTGLRDAVSGVAAPAADSIVYDFGGQNVTTGGATAATNAVNAMTYVLRNLRRIADGTGLDPVTWTIVMRRDAFYEITRIWPCAYYTTGCNVATGATAFANTNDMVALRDDMRTGQYLMVDGQKFDVTIDDAITETYPATGQVQSDIYFVPLTVAGNRPATYMEYQDLTVSLDAANVMTTTANYQLLDDGRLMLHLKTPTNECIQARLLTKPRVVLETPFLAARITNVRYSPLLHSRDSIPGEPYFVNGGGIYQSVPYFYIP